MYAYCWFFQLIADYSTDPQIKRYVDKIDWYIAPVLNPDGYEYSRSNKSVSSTLATFIIWHIHERIYVHTYRHSVFSPKSFKCQVGSVSGPLLRETSLTL